MLMRQPGAERRISPAHESIVLPVVNTSSTSRTCRPASRPGRTTANASSALRIALPAHAAAVDLHAQLRGNPFGDVFGLVVPAAAALDGVQRQGHDHLHVVVQSAFLQAATVPLAHRPRRAPCPAVLEPPDQLPPPAAVDIVEQPRRPLHGQHVAAPPQHGVVGLAPKPRQGRRRPAQRTDRVLALRQHPAAHRAARRKKERRHVTQQATEDRH